MAASYRPRPVTRPDRRGMGRREMEEKALCLSGGEGNLQPCATVAAAPEEETW